MPEQYTGQEQLNGARGAESHPHRRGNPAGRAGLLLFAGLMFSLYGSLATASEPGPGEFELDVDADERISLDAIEAYPEAIVRALGEELGAEVEILGELPDDRVTTRFSRLSLSEALRRIGDNYMLIEDAGDGGRRKLILLSEGEDSERVIATEDASAAPSGEASGQQSFEFVFDPAAAPVRDADTPEPEDP